MENIENIEHIRYMKAAEDLNLFTRGKSAGVIYWKPAGFKLYDNLKSFIKKIHIDNGYLEVKTPCIVNEDVFIQSGHMAKYKENIFSLGSQENSNYVLRPMSCPNHILLFESEIRSYKNLPISFFEFGEVFRNESSGSLQALFRQRQFCQDDSHVFVDSINLEESIAKYLLMAQSAYKLLGFQEIQYDISLRPKERFGSDDDWDKAENSLREACLKNNIPFNELPGEGAFYGPKIELKIKDKLNRFWQLGTLQLDYVLPKRFDLEYINKDGQKEQPIILHHAVLGSLERMIGILLENFGVNLPEFLHPHEKVILPINDKLFDYCKLLGAHLNCEIDFSNESLQKKIAFWKQKGTPNIYVVGNKEVAYFNEHKVLCANLNKNNQNQLITF